MKKLTIKQENFCQVYVQKASGFEAYRLAYDVQPGTKAVTVRVSASKLLKEPHIQHRIEQLREKVRKRHQLKIDDIMAELDENRDLALKERQASAATMATMGKAKVAGFLIDKMQVDVTLRGLKERMRQRKSKGTT
jgi:phage terminase small subunit